MTKDVTCWFSCFVLAFGMSSCTTTTGASGEKMIQAVQSISPTKKEKVNSRFETTKYQCDRHLEMAKQLLEQILAVREARNLQNTLVPFNEIEIQLDSASSLASLLSQVHPDKVVRDESDMCEQDINRFATNLSLNKELFDALNAVENKNMDANSARMLEKTLNDFRRSGVDKSNEDREKIQKLQEELTKIGQDFSRNIREDVRFVEVDPKLGMEGLPLDFVKGHPIQKNGKVKITTDYPDLIPYMTYAADEKSRESLWKKSASRGYPSNQKVLNEMLKKRYELAKLLGFDSYADYVVETKMIKTTKRAADFIEEIAKIASKGSEKEYKVLLDLKRKKEPNAKVVQAYERSYLDEIVKKKNYKLDSKTVRSYFSFNEVKDGLIALTEKLFELKLVKDPRAPVWDKEVEVYDVFSDNQLIGKIYLDLHPRQDKYKHAAQFTLKSGLDKRQIPEGVLVCNFPKSHKPGDPALMDHDQVVTFFHEFGHLLHHILGGQQKWIRFSGVATEWDFVEAPSQLFEEWAWNHDVLKRFAKHHKTKEPIPKTLVKKMKLADEYGKGINARQQMFYAALSLQYYTRDPETFQADKLMQELQKKYSMFPYVDGTYFNLSFGHLDGYSAMYYTYMWSKVIAKDLLSPFKKDGLLDVKHALRYRKTILEKGGTKDAEELVKDFLGRPYQFGAFKEWLETDS